MWRLTLELLQHCQDWILEPDSVSMQAAVQSCEKASMWPLALEFCLVKMSPASCSMVMSSGLLPWHRGVQLLWRMKDSKMRADVVCYNCLLSQVRKVERNWPCVLDIFTRLNIGLDGLRANDHSQSLGKGVVEKMGDWMIPSRGSEMIVKHVNR
eukprot:symbB.v1.2.012512.t1/scaffold866.1/size156716/7